MRCYEKGKEKCSMVWTIPLGGGDVQGLGEGSAEVSRGWEPAPLIWVGTQTFKPLICKAGLCKAAVEV